jgi:hypothetical protein
LYRYVAAPDDGSSFVDSGVAIFAPARTCGSASTMLAMAEPMGRVRSDTSQTMELKQVVQRPKATPPLVTDTW